MNQLLRRPLKDHLAAFAACSRPHVDHLVRRQDGLGIMLHNKDRIAQIPEVSQVFQKPEVVPLMKADTGLIEDIENSCQALN